VARNVRQRQKRGARAVPASVRGTKVDSADLSVTKSGIGRKSLDTNFLRSWKEASETTSCKCLRKPAAINRDCQRSDWPADLYNKIKAYGIEVLRLPGSAGFNLMYSKNYSAGRPCCFTPCFFPSFPPPQTTRRLKSASPARIHGWLTARHGSFLISALSVWRNSASSS